MNGLLLKEKTLTGVICYKDNHKNAIAGLASGKITLDGMFILSRITPHRFERLISSLPT